MAHSRLIAKGALLLALVLIAQSLRFFLPLPPFILVFVIGSLVNAFLLIALLTTNLKMAILISVIAPIVAFLQGTLPIIIFVPLIAMANIIYILVFKIIYSRFLYAAILLCSITKTIVLYYTTILLLDIVQLPPALAKSITFLMSMPQLVTTIVGCLIAILAVNRLHNIKS